MHLTSAPVWLSEISTHVKYIRQ